MSRGPSVCLQEVYVPREVPEFDETAGVEGHEKVGPPCEA